MTDDYYYDKDAQYQLTSAQKAGGWTAVFKQERIDYFDNDIPSDPSTDTPACQIFSPNGQLCRTESNKIALLQGRIGFIATSKYWYDNGSLKIEEHRQSQRLHNPDVNTPAYRTWHENGKLEVEEYYQNGIREDPNLSTPAYKSWDEQGRVTLEAYHSNGLFQNPNPETPARTHWSGGELVWFEHNCHNVEVPAEFWQWTIEDALNADNLEQRRVWFETNGGWEKLESRFDLLDEQPDPANDSFSLRLCEFPKKLDVYDKNARIIFCYNASLDLDGSRRRYALIVPASWGKNALSVMARSFGLTRKEYIQLKVAK